MENATTAGSFCEICLSSYNLKSRDESAVLYLCPDCLVKRYNNRANAQILAGAPIALIGIFVALKFLPFGILLIAIGLAFTTSGLLQRRDVVEVSPLENQEPEEEEEVEPAVSEEIDVEEEYDRLLDYYMKHWGNSLGYDLLEKEIKAYTQRGESFADAIRKIEKRHERELGRA